jgi:hypothetical protein
MAKQIVNVNGVRAVIHHSKKWALTKMDGLKALVMAAILPTLDALYQVLAHMYQTKTFSLSAINGDELKTVAIIGVVGYLIKQFGTETKIVKVQEPEEHLH